MPGAGKTTIGYKLAQALSWAFLDTDTIIESLYAARLQIITDTLGKKAFLDVESQIIRSIRLQRCVIATGGSVVYKQKAMDHLAALGPIIHIEVPLSVIEERVEMNPERGIAIAANQTLQDLYNERAPLYAANASFVCSSYDRSPDECVQEILSSLKADYKIR